MAVLRNILVGCLSAAVVCFGAVGASAKPMKTWETYGWVMGAYSDDDSGAFSHCATSIAYRSGVSLYFSVNSNYRWQMGFSHQQWRLTENERFQLRYNVDNYNAITATGTAVNEQLVVVELPDSKELFEVFRAGRRLNVQGAGQSFSFNLDNTRSVLGELLDCTRRYVTASNTESNPWSSGAGNSGGSNPWSGAKPKAGQGARAPDAASVAALKAEASTVVANVLGGSGITGFRILEEVPEDLKGQHAVWGAADVVGALMIADNTVETASSSLIASDSTSCKGRYFSTRMPTEAEQRGAVRIATACVVNNASTNVEYTILPRPKGGIYVFTIVALKQADPATVQDANKRVHSAAVRVVLSR